MPRLCALVCRNGEIPRRQLQVWGVTTYKILTFRLSYSFLSTPLPQNLYYARPRPSIVQNLINPGGRSLFHNEATKSFTPPTSTHYKIKEQPLGTPRPLRVIIIGAGVSGLNILVQLKKHIPNISHVIYEKNTDIGGTWCENRYPGCASDDPSHSYQYSHTPNPRWSSLFSPAEEIHGYLKNVCEKHELRKYIKCEHSVVRAEWKEECGQWEVDVKDDVTNRVFTDRCEILVDASGIFKYSSLITFIEHHRLTVLAITSGHKLKVSSRLVGT
jgi:hypothetical protein